MKRVLLIWEEVPEATKVYSLAVNDEEFTKLCACHMKFINLSGQSPEDEANLDWLNNWITAKKNKIVINTRNENDIYPFISEAGGDVTVILTGFIL